ncbi:MAG: hypothetical protein NTX61_09290 [Bacteroidetes bacterium]|nr:hypothetical protein [Bacteroidota bacterium]
MKRISLKNNVKNIRFALILLFLIWGFSFCQNTQNRGQETPQKQQTLTPEKTTTIKNILSKYNALTLTAADAKAIHQKFREAGIHAGPETRDAIKVAGFDSEKLRTLDPPPDGNNQERPKPPSAEERMKTVETAIIKPLMLSATQQEALLNAYKCFFSELENLLKIQANPQVPLEKSKIDPLEKARDEKIRLVLSAEQFQKYRELEKASRPPRANAPEPK